MTGTHVHRIDTIRCIPNPALPLIHLTLYERAKIFLFTVTLIAPIRFLAIWILLLIGWGLAKLGSVGIKPGIYSPPPTLMNTSIKYLLRFGIRWIMYIAGFYYVFVEGKADPRAKVLISTHSSLWDSLWMIFYLGTTQGAKIELFSLPIMGDFLRALLSLPIDRKSVDGRRIAIGEILLRAADPHYPPLLLFPTGCCSNTRQLMLYKRGAFQPLCPIQPVGISYPCRFYDMKLSPSSLWDLYRSVCQFTNHMAVTFLPIRYPSEEERDDPILWSRNVREEMAIKCICGRCNNGDVSQLAK
jgi:1-acyl-sn-glycerol-3-phosphate acyltransferase